MEIKERAHDLIIAGGRVVDGTGNPWFRADLGIKAGRIVNVGDLSNAEATRTINARGMAVSPGFIDIHNHGDVGLLLRPEVKNDIMQGITTIVVGNCGSSAAPWSAKAAAVYDILGVAGSEYRTLQEKGIHWNTFAEYLAQVDRQGVAANVAGLVGHGNVRTMVLGWDNRPSTATELEEMKAFVAEAMEAGAFGISYGLLYPPGSFAATSELVALNKVVGQYGGFQAIHMRDERNPEGYRASVLESIEIAERAGIPVQISHLEAHYPNWGMQSEILALLEEARERGVDVTCDVPPYLLSTPGSISVLLPSWTRDGGFARLLERLWNPSTRQKICEEMGANPPFGAGFLIAGNWDKAWLGESTTHPEYTGKTLAEISELRGETPSVQVILDILLEEGADLPAHLQLHHEEDLRVLVTHPLCMIETDAGVTLSQTGMTNPREFGSFPVTFRKYVRGEDRGEEPLERGKKILTLQEAVRKMTSLPAQRIGLRDRGLVREGMWADLVIFDPQTIADKATYTNPYQYPTGIDYVLVNGQAVVEKGNHTGKLPGQVLQCAAV